MSEPLVGVHNVPVGCAKCGHLACVCGIRKAHPDPKCRFRVSSTCAVPIECDHGYDVCPMCDPCTCQPDERREGIKLLLATLCLVALKRALT